MDNIVFRLQALTAAEAIAGDPVRAEIAAMMLELYLIGRINVTFDEATGEPVAELIDHPAPLVQSPMFVAPSLIPALPHAAEEEQEERRQIGFKVN